MSKPWKHPRSGVFWFRREVPRDCRDQVGKSMWQKSLGTTSRTEAERLILPFLAETNRTIEDIRAGRFRSHTDDELRSWIDEWLARGSVGIGGGPSPVLPRLTDEQAVQGLLSGLQVHRGIIPEGDDLDRCLPATAISTLEAMRLFLFLERTASIIAADDKMTTDRSVSLPRDDLRNGA
ncbi:MAG: DUF6538 domain-containing protein [Kiloniellaceae bacterium]